MGIYKSPTDTIMQKLGTRPHSFISGNICFEFSVQLAWETSITTTTKERWLLNFYQFQRFHPLLFPIREQVWKAVSQHILAHAVQTTVSFVISSIGPLNEKPWAAKNCSLQPLPCREFHGNLHAAQSKVTQTAMEQHSQVPDWALKQNIQKLSSPNGLLKGRRGGGGYEDS